MKLDSRLVVALVIIAFLMATTFGVVALANNSWQLLSAVTATLTRETPSGMEIITSNGRRELTLLRGCNQDEIVKMSTGAQWKCAPDLTSSSTGGAAMVLDLGDNGADESAALAEIATTGDTNSIFGEPSADKLLITLSNDWPKADLADALAANPTDCAAAVFAIAIAANGNLTCAAVNFTDLAGAATDGQVPNTITIDLAATATALAGNGANCSAASYALGVDAGGAAEGCTVAFYQTFENEGAGVVQRANINFTGAGVDCVDAGGKTVCTISGGGSTNSFETINASSGTDPLADSAVDTLSVTGSTPITVFGDSSDDSLTISCATCVVTNSSPTLATITTTGNIELGHATDTTLARSGAGLATIEGKGIITRVVTTVLTSGSGATFTPTAGAIYWEIWVTGEGGGGGGAEATDGSSQATGSGGGAGGTAYILYDATEMGADAVYTVGTAAGAGGSSAGGNGTAGENSSFNPAGTGTTVVGTGGGLGTGLSNATPAASVRDGGSGGVPTGGDGNYTGGDGGTTMMVANGCTGFPLRSGAGGGSYLGGGAKEIASLTVAATAGVAGRAYGAGGSGAVACNATAGAAGGDGMTGLIVIKEYLQ